MFFNVIHLEILSFFIYYLFMNLLNIKNRYSFNTLSLFGYLNTILFVLYLAVFLTSTDYSWFYIVIVFNILMYTFSLGYLLTIFTYIYEELHENFRIKNENFLSNKFIFFLQIIGSLLSLIQLTIFTFLIIRLFI